MRRETNISNVQMKKTLPVKSEVEFSVVEELVSATNKGMNLNNVKPYTYTCTTYLQWE